MYTVCYKCIIVCMSYNTVTYTQSTCAYMLHTDYSLLWNTLNILRLFWTWYRFFKKHIFWLNLIDKWPTCVKVSSIDNKIQNWFVKLWHGLFCHFYTETKLQKISPKVLYTSQLQVKVLLCFFIMPI